MIRLSLSLFLVALPTAAVGVEVCIRESVAPSGSVVRLGDVAELRAGEGEVVSALAAMPLMPAPAAGTVHHLRATELLDMLSANGVDVRSLQFTGAERIAIGQAGAVAVGEAVAATPMSVEDRAAMADEVTALVKRYLERQSGHGLWKVDVDADAKQFQAIGALGPDVRVSGGKAPWTGVQRLELAGVQPGARVAIECRVQRAELAVVATRPIERGMLVRRADVELRPVYAAIPVQVAKDVEAIVGKEAVQGIRAESTVLTSQVRAPLVVKRGERVTVRARAAGIAVSTYATAMQDGGVGDLISVESLSTKERFAARVSGRRELEVYAGGVTSGEPSGAVATR
jgi:flagella basal body P-ring formation protein FlgA